jgi:hypothetical protein
MAVPKTKRNGMEGIKYLGSPKRSRRQMPYAISPSYIEFIE